MGAVALHQRHHRPPQGGDAPARQHPARLRDLRAAGARDPPRRRDVLGGQAVLRVRHRQLVVLPVLGRCHDRARGTAADAAIVQERVATERPTLFFAVPTFYAALLSGDLPEDSFASVRLAASAGEALPGPLLTRFKQRFGVDIIDGIGSTEALHIFLSNSPGDIRPGTTGKAVPGYDVAVVGEDGQPLPAGQPGALRVRGDSIALGYWKRTAASRQVFQGEWLVTGDTYVCDADGYFTCLGRNSDMLKSGGIWVSPAEVESRLIEHPAVREAAVVGVADEHGIDKPVAVVIAEGVNAEDLVAWCRDGLAHFKAPHHVVFVDELPKTATGKLQRFKVRHLLAGSSKG